jgi:hypothetical protein
MVGAVSENYLSGTGKKNVKPPVSHFKKRLPSLHAVCLGEHIQGGHHYNTFPAIYSFHILIFYTVKVGF